MSKFGTLISVVVAFAAGLGIPLWFLYAMVWSDPHPEYALYFMFGGVNPFDPSLGWHAPDPAFLLSDFLVFLFIPFGFISTAVGVLWQRNTVLASDSELSLRSYITIMNWFRLRRVAYELGLTFHFYFPLGYAFDTTSVHFDNAGMSVFRRPVLSITRRALVVEIPWNLIEEIRCNGYAPRGVYSAIRVIFTGQRVSPVDIGLSPRRFAYRVERESWDLLRRLVPTEIPLENIPT